MPKQRTTHASAQAQAPSAAEAQEFRAAVRDVKPLTPQSATIRPGMTGPARTGPLLAGSAMTGSPLAGLPPGSPRARRRKPAPVAPDLDDSMPLIAPLTAEVGDVPVGSALGGATLSFQRAGVRTQVVRRLRRGLIPVEDELDLHGLTQTAARDRLAGFLQGTRAAGCRCVRIIHGKGYRSGARGPILKIAVDSWLRRHLDVMAFTSARPIDGGTGAVYVLLRA